MIRYCLKPMVFARLFAESTVLIAFISAPILLLVSGKMHQLDTPIQVLFYLLGATGLAILPWFGFLTWQVRVDENGLTSDALFRHQFCAWQTMTKITRRASWNWQRYVIDFEGGSLHFPVLLAKSEQLVQLIRDHLPVDTAAPVGLSNENPHRVFKYDPLSMSCEIVQAVVACIFVTLFWFFFAFNLHKHFHSVQDAAIILLFCLAITIVFIWRLVVVLSMPKRVELTKEKVSITNLFSIKDLVWSDVLGLTTPMPLLPEGFTIKSRRGNFLIGTGMDAADELQQIVIQEITEKRDLAFIAAAMKKVGDVQTNFAVEIMSFDPEEAEVEIETARASAVSDKAIDETDASLPREPQPEP